MARDFRTIWGNLGQFATDAVGPLAGTYARLGFHYFWSYNKPVPDRRKYAKIELSAAAIGARQWAPLTADICAAISGGSGEIVVNLPPTQATLFPDPLRG